MLAIVLLALVVAAALAIAWLVNRVPRDDVAAPSPGRLEVSEQAVGTWRVGTVDVALTEAGLRMTDTARDGLVVWESPPETAFVLGVLGSVEWEDYRRYFWPRTDHECELTDQSVRSATDDGGRLEISGVLAGCGQLREFLLELRPGPTRGDVVLELSGRELDALTLVTGRSPDAGVHGFGEQYAPFDVSGRLLPIVVREQGVGRGEQPVTLLADLSNRGAGGNLSTTYAAWPSFVTADVRGVALDPDLPESHAYAVADTRRADTVGLTTWAPRLHALLTADSDPLALIERRARPQDRPPLPGWLSQGAVVGIQGGTEKVRSVVEDLMAEGAALSAVWLQDWTGARKADLGDRLWWTWQLDEQRYPGWDQLVSDLDDQGIRVLTYVNTWLVDAAEKDDQTRNLYAEAADAGYLVLDPDGSVYELDQGGFDAALVDLTNPDARDWYADVIVTEVLGAGAAGFMADFGEGLPFDAQLADGEPDVEHNRWPLLWAQTVRDACERAGQPDCVTWFRTGSGGMAEYAPMFWNGDQIVTYSPQDGLASALLGTFNAGVSGWHLTHSDIGGYISVDALVRDYVRSPELNRRWAEMEAFGVMMRTHESNRPADNEQVYDTERTRADFARMTRLFAALAPYRADVVAEAVETGVPALRHTWLQYPGSAAAQSDTQFFLGSSVLVAPVLAESRDSVEVSFPPGEWVHLLTGETFEGDATVQVAAPLGTPAAFVRADDDRRADLEAMVAGVDR